MNDDDDGPDDLPEARLIVVQIVDERDDENDPVIERRPAFDPADIDAAFGITPAQRIVLDAQQARWQAVVDTMLANAIRGWRRPTDE